MNGSQYEIHGTSAGAEQPSSNPQDLPWREEQRGQLQPPFVVSEADDVLWCAVDVAGDRPLRPVASRGHADLGLQVIRRRIGSELAVVSRRADLLINGLPALSFSVVGARDSLTLAGVGLMYVTERVTPQVGAPTAEQVGQKCAACRIPFAADTRVVSCRCGAPYHAETAESNPDTPQADLLMCSTRLKACLSCGRELTCDSYLVWDPREL